jgi:hypothetical protein
MDDELKNGSGTGMEQPGEGATGDQDSGQPGTPVVFEQDGEDAGGVGEASELDSEGAPDMIGETPEPVDDSEEGDLAVEELPEDAGKEPGKTQLFLRKLLWWAAGVAGIFAIGVLAIWIVRVSPLQKELAATQAALEEVQAEAEALQDDYDEQLDINTDLEARNEDLQQQLTVTQADQQLLRALADVSAARVALAEDDVVTAKAALSGTMKKLEALQDLLPEEVQATVQGMIARLELALNEIDQDTFAATNDLEVLWTNLQALEASLFQ